MPVFYRSSLVYRSADGVAGMMEWMLAGPTVVKLYVVVELEAQISTIIILVSEGCDLHPKVVCLICGWAGSGVSRVDCEVFVGIAGSGAGDQEKVPFPLAELSACFSCDSDCAAFSCDFNAG